MQFKWLNESKIEKKGDRWEIYAPPHTDFFCNASGEEGEAAGTLCNAPVYYTEIEGDFVLKVKVSHDCASTYDAAALLVYKDETNWAKRCFEKTDIGPNAVVSVVTRGQSDDANGCNIADKSVWLQICRVGDAFAFHFSEDGAHFYMTRFFHFPAGKVAKVGLVAQSPTGSGGMRTFEHLTIEHKTVENIRAGI